MGATNIHVGLKHISVLTTCTFMFQQVCTIESSFFKKTSDMHHYPFEGQHPVHIVFIALIIVLLFDFNRKRSRPCLCAIMRMLSHTTLPLWWRMNSGWSSSSLVEDLFSISSNTSQCFQYMYNIYNCIFRDEPFILKSLNCLSSLIKIS